MKKLFLGVALVAALALPVVATSATLANGHEQNCKGDGELWHFVNNQTGGATSGFLKVEFKDENGSSFYETSSDPKVLKSVLQWDIYTDGDATLVNAWSGTQLGLSDIPGRLVLSDFCKKGDA